MFPNSRGAWKCAAEIAAWPPSGFCKAGSETKETRGATPSIIWQTFSKPARRSRPCRPTWAVLRVTWWISSIAKRPMRCARSSALIWHRRLCSGGAPASFTSPSLPIVMTPTLPRKRLRRFIGARLTKACAL